MIDEIVLPADEDRIINIALGVLQAGGPPHRAGSNRARAQPCDRAAGRSCP
ncbi:hypothetical protein [Burkholderia sp. 567]|uniref:hypothetical protein n=1 Tax=Burkholderia sp. 567 TaxID=3156413 RepID=UPI0033960D7B